MNLCQFYFVTTLILYEFYSAFCLLKINSIFTLSFLPFLRLHGRDTHTQYIQYDIYILSWWNDVPNSIWAAESLAIFKNLFHLYLTL